MQLKCLLYLLLIISLASCASDVQSDAKVLEEVPKGPIDGELITCVIGESNTIERSAVPAGSRQKFNLIFENTTASTLRIGEVRKSCVCTDPEFSFEQLMPGQRGEFRVGVDVRDVETLQTNSMRVQLLNLNSEEIGSILVIIKLDAVRMLHIDRGDLVLGQIQAEGSELPAFKVSRGKSPVPFEQIEVTSSVPNLVAEIHTIDENNWMVTLKQDAPLVIGALKGSISISPLLEESESALRGVRKLKCAGVITGNIRLSPTVIFWGSSGLGETVERELKIIFDQEGSGGQFGGNLPIIEFETVKEGLDVKVIPTAVSDESMSMKVLLSAQRKMSLNRLLPLTIIPQSSDSEEYQSVRVNVLLRGEFKE